REAYMKAHGAQDVLLQRFAAPFFSDQVFGTGTPLGLYTPQAFIATDSAGRSYLYWRTEDIPARTPRFDKARAEVLTAWKLLQARDLARTEADRLADLAKRAQGDAPQLRDLAAQHGGREYFELGPMARKMPVTSPTPGFGRQYTDPTVPPDKIPYPGPELIKRLLGLRDDTKGATVVVSDQPQNHFYVSSLLQREEPTQDEFHKAYV